MGRRQDGRIEPGQSLKSAISARAWNRAQDAADIVLGERVGFGAEAASRLPDRLFRNVRLLVPGSTRLARFGMIVRHWNSEQNIPSNPSPAGQRPPNTVGQTTVEVSRPVAFVDRRTTANLDFGVVFTGSLPTLTSLFTASTLATICTHGTCLAIVRKNPGGFLPRVRPAVIRYSSDTETNLIGIAEDSDCGTAELVYWTNIKPFSSEQQTAEGIDPVEALDDTTNNIYYAVIRL